MTGGPDPGFLRAFAETRAFLLGRPGRVQITPDGGTVLFLRSPPREPTLGLFALDVATGATRELVTPAQLLGGAEEQLSDAEKARRERLRVVERGFTTFALSPDGAFVLLPLSGRLFLHERSSGSVRELPIPGGAAVFDARFSPEGARVAFVRGHDLWVVDLAGGSARPLTAGGSEDLLYGQAEFVAQEEMHRQEGYWWSPDGRAIACAEVDQRGVERFAIADPARPERAPLSFAYPRAGRDNVRVRLALLDPAASTPVPRWVSWDRERYPYLARVAWDSPAAPLAILVQTREQREAALLAVDAATGTTRPLVVETDPAWVNLERDLPRWLPDGSGLLWPTERTGRRALELRRPDGSLEREVVPAGAGFLSLAHVDPAGAHVTVLLAEPTSTRIERFAVRGAERVALTDDHAEHAPVFARDGALFVDTRTTADAWPETLVVRAEGARTTALVPSVAEEPPFRVRLELTTVEAEGRTLHAAIVRPRGFEPGRRYPVVLHVYGGPHALVVKSDARNYLVHQWLADHGAVVVAIDNRGTPRRDRAWERAVSGNLVEAPLADQVAGLRALAARHSELDLGRAGIYGWSFGGTMAALAVMCHPDLFTVAVAGAPVGDWHDYDTHYTERYLDLPGRNPDGYRASSPISHAADLRRPLLLVHGTADDNVYFFHSIRLADALVRAGRPFSFLPLAGATHQVPDPVLRQRLWERIAGFLFQHL